MCAECGSKKQEGGPIGQVESAAWILHYCPFSTIHTTYHLPLATCIWHPTLGLRTSFASISAARWPLDAARSLCLWKALEMIATLLLVQICLLSSFIILPKQRSDYRGSQIVTYAAKNEIERPTNFIEDKNIEQSLFNPPPRSKKMLNQRGVITEVEDVIVNLPAGDTHTDFCLNQWLHDYCTIALISLGNFTIDSNFSIITFYGFPNHSN